MNSTLSIALGRRKECTRAWEQPSRGDLAGVRRDAQAAKRRDGARHLGLSQESHDAKHRQAAVVDLRTQPGKVTNPQLETVGPEPKYAEFPRQCCAQEAIADSKAALEHIPKGDFSAFHSSDLFFCKLKGSKSSNGMGCGISFLRDGNAPGLPPRM